MKMILKITGVAFIHLAFFACYPDTGPLGVYYLAVSLLLWSVFLLFINTSTALVRFISGAAGLTINAASFALMAGALAVTMPQADKVSVLDKLQNEDYPDRATVAKGLARLGIHLDVKVPEGTAGIKELDREAAKAVEKLKGKK
ncbi:MAG: hypothetical protein M0011_05150 [Elusimicrobia bacterium]|nr:hypothetical protein [Elusimicrobiota bacterium]